MKKPYILAAVVTMALGAVAPLPAQAQAQATTVTINGLHSNSESSCSQATVILISSDCSYSGQRIGETFYGWSGPAFGGGYYTAGSVGDNFAYVPVPGDGKIQPTINGSLIFTGAGATATIEGTIIVGPAVRNAIVGNLTRGVERWDAITHSLAPTPVTTATANAAGGFDYVIGSNGTPGALCLTADPTDCFPSEFGADGGLSAVQNVWNNGVPPAVGVEGTPLNGGPGASIGPITTAVITNYSNSCAVPTDCTTNGRVVWGGTGPQAESPGWDNLLLAISTDAAGNITSGKGWWTQEYAIPVGPIPQRSVPNSWQASRITFTGAAEGAGATCPDFDADVVGGTTNNVIDARPGCTGFDQPPVIAIVTAPVSGTADINPEGNIIYTPNDGFSGTDTLTYSGTSGNSSDNGVLTIRVAPDPVPVIQDGAIDTGVTNALTLTVTLGSGSAAQHTLAVTVDGANGRCTTSSVGGFSVTYAPDAGFAGVDSCTLTITDANGDTDTALVSVTVRDEIVIEVDGGGSSTDPASLALLAGLAALIRRRSRRVGSSPVEGPARRGVAAALLAGLLAGPALAAGGSMAGAYAGAGVSGTSLQSDDPQALTNQLGAGVAGSFSDFAAGGQLFAGWLWSSEAGVEIRYADSGDGKSSLRTRSSITGDVTDIGDVKTSIKGYTLYLVRLIPELPLPERWSLYGKAGWTWQDLNVGFTSNGAEGFPASGSASDSDSGLAVAVGTRWRFARNWAATVEGETLWVNFNGAFDEPWRLGVNVEYWFGGDDAAH
jgi:hypothetical protein